MRNLAKTDLPRRSLLRTATLGTLVLASRRRTTRAHTPLVLGDVQGQ